MAKIFKSVFIGIRELEIQKEALSSDVVAFKDSFLEIVDENSFFKVGKIGLN